MNEYRAKAQDLCMSDAMPFSQQFQYRTSMPLKDIIHDRFFLPVAGNLRRGDQIRLVSFDRPVGPRSEGRVVEVADVIVVDKTKEVIELALLGDIREIKAPAAAAEASEPRLPREQFIQGNGKAVWDIGKRAFKIMVGDEVVAIEPDRDTAMKIARGDIPLPVAEPEAA